MLLFRLSLRQGVEISISLEDLQKSYTIEPSELSQTVALCTRNFVIADPTLSMVPLLISSIAIYFVT